MTTRWNTSMYNLLQRLKDKLGLMSMNEVLRLAVIRLAEAEGLTPGSSRRLAEKKSRGSSNDVDEDY